MKQSTVASRTRAVTPPSRTATALIVKAPVRIGTGDVGSTPNIDGSSPTATTLAQLTPYHLVFEYLNRRLFDGALPDPMLGFSCSCTEGMFIPGRWRHRRGMTRHEICLNPATLDRPWVEVLAVLVHQMVHLWQHLYGHPSRGDYHNREMGEKMESLGLVPSRTGAPGGRRTGHLLRQYVLPGGLFERVVRAMPREYELPFRMVPDMELKHGSHTKTCYRCSGCGMKFWGGSGIEAICTCGGEFVAGNTGNDSDPVPERCLGNLRWRAYQQLRREFEAE